MSFKTFSNGTKRLVIDSQNGYCLDCLEPIHSIHHKLPNTKANRRNFPLFIQSPMNAAGLCFNDHKNNAFKHKITEREARVYEIYLMGIRI